MANNLTAVARLGAPQNIAFSTTAGTSSPIGSETYRVRVLVTSAAYVAIGNGIAATTSDTMLAANFPETFVCTPGQTVSVLQVSASGIASITELS
jgi:hypothetical protein